MATLPLGELITAQNIHSLRDAWLAFYGVLATTEVFESDYSPVATAIAIGKHGHDRMGYIVSNTGTANVAIGFSTAVTISTGILLLQGQTFVSNWLQDGEAVWKGIHVISTAGGGTVHMVENVLQGG